MTTIDGTDGGLYGTATPAEPSVVPEVIETVAAPEAVVPLEGRFSGRRALVTGGGSGIGLATVRRLVAEGAEVFAADLDPAAAVAEGAEGIPCDVTDPGDVTAAALLADPIDLLFANAGVAELGAVEEVALPAWRRQIDVNLLGVVRMCQLVLPAMRARRGGRILVTGSMGGDFTFPFAGAYHASKYALEALADALRFEVEPFGVHVALLKPAVVDTPLARAGATALDPAPGSPYAPVLEVFAEVTRASYGRGGTGVLSPDDVAAVVVRAAEEPEPRTRYRVGELAEQMAATRRAATDRDWDAGLRRQYGLPAPAV
jgi:NAD(P)-dependent dehydrogenase (short-subunit alcohol dehydrogenase family)